MPEKAQDYPVHGLQRRGLKMIDFFSGAGIFSLGITDSNLGDVATAIDNCEYACKSWNTIHRKNGVCRNMDVNAFLKKASTAARKSEVGRKEYHYDMVVASPPCQDWTILNRYRKESGRSLIVEVGNMIECLPNVDYLLVENVAEWGRARYWKEMGQVDDGDTKTTPYCYLLAELLSFGYQIHSECIDSAHHGSPQSRNRLILNAVIKDKKLTSLPNPSHYFKSTRRQHSSYVKPANACGESQPESRIPLHGPCRFVTVEDTIGDLPPAVRMGFKPKVPLHVFTRDEEEFTIERHERVRRQGQFKTIARNPVPGAPKFHYSFNRQLTLRERALAQGFFKEDIARLHRLYDGKHMTTQSRDLLNVQIGNAVSRQLAFALACSMNATLD
ncbi:S-adenosyl-L-methionine-dependent methyltransferase [Chytriomyces sp. MP71]|nr:S-adenosyl-L-methionine-dependent methyltransferase [Chytriomyces sp. MP71]